MADVDLLDPLEMTDEEPVELPSAEPEASLQDPLSDADGDGDEDLQFSAPMSIEPPRSSD